MPCYHPMEGFDTGMLTDSGKKEIVIMRDSAYPGLLNKSLAEKRVGHKINFNSHYMRIVNKDIFLNKTIMIPCGMCVGCRLEYSRQWATRCMLESKCYPEDMCWFVTLTYDDAHCPDKLNKKHLQDFWKRLRSYYGYNNKQYGIRYFACGEYASRPHYHAIIFNWKPEDLKFWSQRNGNTYYRSKVLERIWPYGMCIIGECTFDSCAYVARYVMKKKMGKEKSDEFIVSSRRPGIGRPYLDKLGLDVYETDKIYENIGFSHEFTPPKYFDRIMEKIDPNKVESVKAARLLLACSEILTQRMLHAFRSDEILRDFQEENKKRQLERLKRNQV